MWYWWILGMYVSFLFGNIWEIAQKDMMEELENSEWRIER